MSKTATKPTHPTISADILRAYDIRGIYGETLTDTVVYQLGRAFATLVARRQDVARPRIVTARDGRQSSPALSEALKQGMQAAGAHVVDVGLGPTPMCYFADMNLDADGAIMLTGSHNPPSHNGLKMICGHNPFFGEDIQALGALVRAGDFHSGDGREERHPLHEAYLARLVQDGPAADGKPLRVVWDAGNGAAGEICARLAECLPGQHTALYTTIDGTFPYHHPDPTVPENLTALIDEVQRQEADVGIAFDGDGDRIGVVDGKGAILWGDQLLTLFARDLLARQKGATIIADVKASQTLFDDIAAHGGQPLMWKTGHSLIKQKMRETGAPLAGEMSGHLFFADQYGGYDDGLYAGVRLLELLSRCEQSLSELHAGLPRLQSTPEMRIDCDESRKFAVIDEIRERLRRRADAGGALEVNEVDGVRVTVAEGWWLVRASNTQAALIVRCESQDEAGLSRLKAMVGEELAASLVEAVV